MSILDSLLGGGDDSSESTSEEGDPFLQGGGGGGGGDDPFGDVDDDFGGDMGGEFGAFDEMEDDGADTAELENRMDELENEFSSLSSSVNTIKSENEEISGSLEDIEENVRQLLEIYEMVTRGVNPFVDDSDVSATSGSMELFDTGSESDSKAEVDESIAEADASDFFDEDIADDDGDELTFDDEIDSGPLEEDSIDEFDAETDADLTGSMDGDSSMEENSGEKSFEDLKAEYESGDAEWATDDNMSDDDANDSSEGDSPEPAEDSFEVEDDPTDPEGDLFETEADTESGVDAFEPEGEDSLTDEVDGTDSVDSGSANESKHTDSSPVETGESHDGNPNLASNRGVTGEKPYIDELPAGYVSDLVVMEWLEFLVEASDVENASRAIAYYESISWVSESAAEMLRKFLDGFEGSDNLESDPLPHPSLDIDHHTQSLKYIARLEGPSPGAAAMGSWNLGNRRGALQREPPGQRRPAAGIDRSGMTRHESESESRESTRVESERGERTTAPTPDTDPGPEAVESVRSPPQPGQPGSPTAGEAASDGSGEPTVAGANEPEYERDNESGIEPGDIESSSPKQESAPSPSKETPTAPSEDEVDGSAEHSTFEDPDESNVEGVSDAGTDSDRHSPDGSGWPLARRPPRYEPVGSGRVDTVSGAGDAPTRSSEDDDHRDSLPGESSFGYGSRYSSSQTEPTDTDEA